MLQQACMPLRELLGAGAKQGLTVVLRKGPLCKESGELYKGSASQSRLLPSMHVGLTASAG